MTNLTQEQLRRLTRLGAMTRLNDLREEEAAIRREFPELFGSGRPRQDAAEGAGRKRRKRRSMSAAGRKAVSERMRKYWADRRKGKAGK